MKKKERKVDCKKIEKLIPLYLNKQLSSYETEQFLKHVTSCKNCKEELSIQYMATKGLERAEKENDYNLVKALDDLIKNSFHQIKTHEFLYFAFSFCIIFVVCIIIAAILLIF